MPKYDFTAGKLREALVGIPDDTEIHLIPKECDTGTWLFLELGGQDAPPIVEFVLGGWYLDEDRHTITVARKRADGTFREAVLATPRGT